MNKEFSAEFMHDIADVIDGCRKAKTDTVELIFNVGEKELHIEMTFSVKVTRGE